MKTPILVDFNQPPEAAMAYLENKGFELDFDRTQVLQESHHQAFTVAKVARADLLFNLYTALIDAQKQGLSFKAFKDGLQDTLETKGWKQGLREEKDNPLTRNLSEEQRSARRLKTIFQTNMNVAYNIGRHQQMRQLQGSVYWFYASALLDTTRDSHRERHGIVKHRDDEWWKLNYPPNGWGCHCKVRAYSKRQLERKGFKIHEEALPDLATDEWTYDIGAGSRVGKLTQMNIEASLDRIPVEQQDAKARKTRDRKKLVNYFFEILGIQPGDMMLDPIGDPMIIDRSLFESRRDAKKDESKSKRMTDISICQTLLKPSKTPMRFTWKWRKIASTSLDWSSACSATSKQSKGKNEPL